MLRREGVLVLSSINPAWADFNPSPFATGYFEADELGGALQGMYRSVELILESAPIDQPLAAPLDQSPQFRVIYALARI